MEASQLPSLITGKMAARYLTQPGTQILGQGNDPSDRNERVIELDALMVVDAAIYQVDELMNYYDIRQIYTKELGRSLAYEYDKRVARMVFAAANNTTEPLNKDGTASPWADRALVRLSILASDKATFDAKTRQTRGDELVEAIFTARVGFEKDVPIDNTYCVCCRRMTITPSPSHHAPSTLTSTVAAETARLHRVRLHESPESSYSSNHVVQPNYDWSAGDYNTDYAQDLSKCRGLIFHRDAVGVVSLLSPSLQMTGSEFRVQYQSDLACGPSGPGHGAAAC